jgi:hypothetical protein
MAYEDIVDVLHTVMLEMKIKSIDIMCNTTVVGM